MNFKKLKEYFSGNAVIVIAFILFLSAIENIIIKIKYKITPTFLLILILSILCIWLLRELEAVFQDIKIIFDEQNSPSNY